MLKLKEFQKLCHQNSINHGFWDDKDNQNIPTKLALIHAEVSEALEAYRDVAPGEEEKLKEIQYVNWSKPVGFASELADILIRTLDLAEYFKIDLEEIAQVKYKYNLTRPFKHGRRV